MIELLQAVLHIPWHCKVHFFVGVVPSQVNSNVFSPSPSSVTVYFSFKSFMRWLTSSLFTYLTLKLSTTKVNLFGRVSCFLARPKYKNFPVTCWKNFFRFASRRGDSLGVSAYWTVVPHVGVAQIYGESCRHLGGS